MLLTFLLVGFLLITAIFAIALVWDYAHGISPFGNNMNAAILDLPLDDTSQNTLSQSAELVAPAGESERRTEISNWQNAPGRLASASQPESIAV